MPPPLGFPTATARPRPASRCCTTCRRRIGRTRSSPRSPGSCAGWDVRRCRLARQRGAPGRRRRRHVQPRRPRHAGGPVRAGRPRRRRPRATGAATVSASVPPSADGFLRSPHDVARVSVSASDGLDQPAPAGGVSRRSIGGVAMSTCRERGGHDVGTARGRACRGARPRHRRPGGGRHARRLGRRRRQGRAVGRRSATGQHRELLLRAGQPRQAQRRARPEDGSGAGDRRCPSWTPPMCS